jgi:hypothetical protein
VITHITLAKSSLLAAIPLVIIGLPIGGFVSPNDSYSHYAIKVESFEKHKKTNHQCDTPAPLLVLMSATKLARLPTQTGVLVIRFVRTAFIHRVMTGMNVNRILSFFV